MVYFSIEVHADRENEDWVCVSNGPRIESEPLQVAQVLTDKADRVESADTAVQLESRQEPMAPSGGMQNEG